MTDWTSVPEIAGTPTTRASARFEQRAGELQQLVGDAHAYLSRGLGTDFDPLLLVVDPSDWTLAGEGDDVPPYGIPYASDEPAAWELVVPADPSDNFLVDLYAQSGTREQAERFADLIAVHELGHLHVRALGLTLPMGWLGELLATYLSACFLTTHRPDDAATWFGLSRRGRDRVTPPVRSLEHLDEVYFAVGPEAYIWYQDELSTMVEEVVPVRGLELPLRLRDAGLTPESDTATTVAAAEAIHPGFAAWAASLRG